MNDLLGNTPEVGSYVLFDGNVERVIKNYDSRIILTNGRYEHGTNQHSKILCLTNFDATRVQDLLDNIDYDKFEELEEAQEELRAKNQEALNKENKMRRGLKKEVIKGTALQGKSSDWYVYLGASDGSHYYVRMGWLRVNVDEYNFEEKFNDEIRPNTYYSLEKCKNKKLPMSINNNYNDRLITHLITHGNQDTSNTREWAVRNIAEIKTALEVTA